MISFKEFLQEKFKPRYVRDVGELVFDSTSHYIPLTTKMIERIFGKSELTKACHITSEEGFQNLVKIQNSKKQISTFTEIEGSDVMSIQHGVASPGGVLVMLEGYPVIQFPKDIASTPDPHGRRWIDVWQLIPNFAKRAVDEKIRLLNKYTDPLMGKDTVLSAFAEKADKKTKAKFIKDYVDFCEKYILKNLDRVKEALIEYGEDSQYSWNEIIMNRFKIKKVFVVYQSSGSKQEQVQAENFKEKWKKYDCEFLPTHGFYMAAFNVIDRWL